MARVGEPRESQTPASLPELAQIDGLLEHRVRLAICVLLARHEAITFARLKDVLGETDGSLGAHLRKLEDARYVLLDRTFANRRPVTWYRLSAKGRKHLEVHLDSLTQLIERARETRA